MYGIKHDIDWRIMAWIDVNTVHIEIVGTAEMNGIEYQTIVYVMNSVWTSVHLMINKRKPLKKILMNNAVSIND